METNALRKMADSSHLERMGRELKCPICLSLLNSTVSLTCNHVFCNSCIEKSMKSASSCPVCKVPYRRREIRPAPHMDSLVSIYKSMEVASGFNIFVTQNLPLTKLADEENQSEGGRTSGRQKRGKTFQSIQQNHRGFKGKRSKQSLEINQENLNLDPVKKPSFPRKKRVQVPQCPPSETPVQPAMFEVGLGKITKVPPERGPGVLKEKPAVNEKGESIFTPFFWLRDEDDVEKLTQMTDGGHNMDISPPNAPCFSDIKDSDDEIPSKVPPKGEANITFNDANYFDSEMFEWTQRPCSPELCSSPPKIQVADREEFDGSQIKESKLSTQAATTTGKCEIENIQNVVPKLADNVEVSLTFLSSPRIDNTNGKDRMKRSKNRSRKACKRTVKKQENRTLGEVLGAQAASYKVAKSIIGEKKHGNNVNSINSCNRTRKGEKEVVFGSCAAEPVSENFSADKTLSAEANGLNLNEKTNVTNLPASSDQKETSTKIVVQRQSCHLKRSKIKTTTNLKCDQEQTCKKKKKISTCDNMSKDNKLVNGIQDGCTEASVKNTQQVGKFHCNSEVRNLQDSIEKEKIFPSSSRVVLHKCETVPNKNQCVFCHSTENSEAAGEMIHYVNGKPVAADYNEGSKVIHAHRNCTEWAPNVYFEDDIAINLEAELARSRRIRCCCCDIKGAALGCYEKSCHKSFHVPCAKLIPQCRWDNDNFVMLCPIHASSKLPSEMSGSQIKKKKTCIPKRLTKNHQPEVFAKHAGNTYEHWNSRGSPGKLVLCCSALTNDEKEIVSEFERLSGVAVLKKWDSSVTHIIASIDENRACRRTLKILMGILEGKWILSMEWIKACMKAMEPVDEQHYEIGLDVHGVRDGPRLGRLRVLNKQPKLFDGCKFYFFGEFVASYRGYLHDLVIAAGGTVLQRKPISGDPTSSTFIIYSLELPDKCDPKKGNSILNQRRLGAEALASSNGGRVASNSWVLNSIAACKLQKLAG